MNSTSLTFTENQNIRCMEATRVMTKLENKKQEMQIVLIMYHRQWEECNGQRYYTRKLNTNACSFLKLHKCNFGEI